jgi:multidrug efflux pump subunit AcrA (membrane-fusion protein)
MWNMRRDPAATWILLVALCAATLSCSNLDRDPVPVMTVADQPPAAEASPKKGLVLTGVLRATDSELLDTPTSTTWQLSLQWLIDEGTAVEPGDAIARFDPGATQTNLHNQQDQLEEKRQEREASIAQDAIRGMELELALRKAEVAYKKAQIDAAVTQDLLAGKDYRRRQHQLRETEQGFQNAQLDSLDHETASHSKISGMDIELLELGKDIQDLEEELESLTLRATRKGIVLHEMHRWFGRTVRVGDRMQATMPIASIPEVHSLEVEAWAGETDAARLEAGALVRILLDADPSREFDGVVDLIGTAGERRESWGRGSYRRVAIRIDRVDPGIMKPGMSVRCEVDLETAADPSLVASREEAP